MEYVQYKNGKPHYYREIPGPDFDECIQYQPYRSTPLVLPGPKVKKEAPTTESYLRHYPNPKVRAHPGHHDFQDVLMKQRVADHMLHRVVGADADSGRVFHKQFNSPIGLYSDPNIEQQIRQTVPYKKTVVFDPSKSETYRAIQEDSYGGGSQFQEVASPATSNVYNPARLVPGKKPAPSLSPRPSSRSSFNVVSSYDDQIRQSGSFNRLMNSVLGSTNY